MIQLSMLANIGSALKRLFLHRHKGSDAKTHTSLKKKLARKGHVPLIVGEEEKRYEVPIGFLNFLELNNLLTPPGGEYLEQMGFGPLRVYCSTEFFDELFRSLELHNNKVLYVD